MSIAVKLNKYLNSFFKLDLKSADIELYKSIEQEFLRQQNHTQVRNIIYRIFTIISLFKTSFDAMIS